MNLKKMVHEALRENICIGETDVEEAIRAALKNIGIDDYIQAALENDLPNAIRGLVEDVMLEALDDAIDDAITDLRRSL